MSSVERPIDEIVAEALERLVGPAIETMVTAAVNAAVERTPGVKMVPGTFLGSDQSGDGIVRLDSEDPDEPEALHAPVLGPHPLYGARVLVAFVPPMAAYVLGEVNIARVVGELQPRVLYDQPSGEVTAINAEGEVVGRLAADLWYAGSQDGSRIQLDPFGGLRVFNEGGHLAGVLNAAGLHLREPETGAVRTAVLDTGIRLVGPSGNSVSIVADQISKAPPKWGEYWEVAPGTTMGTRAMQPLTTLDLDMRYVVAWSRNSAAIGTFTPPGGYSELLDMEDHNNACAMAATIATKVGVSTATQVFTNTSAAYEFSGGNTVVFPSDGVTAPSVVGVSPASSHWVNAQTAIVEMDLLAPTGIVEGDVLAAFVSLGNDGGSIPTAWSVPLGWEMLGAGYKQSGSGVTTSMLASGAWYKCATATDVAQAASGVPYHVTMNVLGAATSRKKVHAVVVAVRDVAPVLGGADIKFEPQSFCRVYKTADQQLTGEASWVTQTWGGVSEDPGTNYNSALNGYICPQPGPYQFTVKAMIDLNAVGEQFEMKVRCDPVSGADYDVSSTGLIVSPGGLLHLRIVDSAVFETGDRLVVQVRGPSTRSVDGNAPATAQFWTIQRTLST